MSNTDGLINKIVARIARKYYVKESSGHSVYKFQIIRELANFKLLRSFTISNTSSICSVLFVSYTVESYQQRAFPYIPRTDESVYLFVTLRCRRDYGIISIRPKTLIDKINGLFSYQKNNVPNENKFRSSLMVEVGNVEKAEFFFKDNVVNLLMENDNIIMEIVGREILIRSGLESVSEDELDPLIKLVFDLALLLENNE
jgi:hypothetical protein